MNLRRFFAEAVRTQQIHTPRLTNFCIGDNLHGVASEIAGFS